MVKKTFALSLFLGTLAHSQFSGGAGTEESPYQIKTATDLDSIRYFETSHFVLQNDIGLSGTSFDSLSSADNIVFSPITTFYGSVNGGGFSIHNLYINSPLDTVGLFGNIRGAKVYDLNLVVPM